MNGRARGFGLVCLAAAATELAGASELLRGQLLRPVELEEWQRRAA